MISRSTRRVIQANQFTQLYHVHTDPRDPRLASQPRHLCAVARPADCRHQGRAQRAGHPAGLRSGGLFGNLSAALVSSQPGRAHLSSGAPRKERFAGTLSLRYFIHVKARKHAFPSISSLSKCTCRRCTQTTPHIRDEILEKSRRRDVVSLTSAPHQISVRHFTPVPSCGELQWAGSRLASTA